jgi:hypothetical protein
MKIGDRLKARTVKSPEKINKKYIKREKIIKKMAKREFARVLGFAGRSGPICLIISLFVSLLDISLNPSTPSSGN